MDAHWREQEIAIKIKIAEIDAIHGFLRKCCDLFFLTFKLVALFFLRYFKNILLLLDVYVRLRNASCNIEVLFLQEDSISKHVAEILSAWAECLPAKDMATALAPTEDVDVRLAKMLESQSLPTTTQKSYTEEEKRIREAILAQYSQMSDEDNSEGDGEEDGASGGDCGIEKNLNAATIVQQEREKREKAKLESQKKKEKDKEDR